MTGRRAGVRLAPGPRDRRGAAREAAGGGGMVAEQSAALVVRAIETIWNRGDLAAADALVAPGYVNHGGLIPDLIRGPEAIKFSVALYRLAFPGLRIAVEGLRADGETVVLRWTARPGDPGAGAGGAPAGQ